MQVTFNNENSVVPNTTTTCVQDEPSDQQVRYVTVTIPADFITPLGE